MRSLFVLAVLSAASVAASANDFYLTAGVPGAGFGYSRTVADGVSLRGEVTTTGQLSRSKRSDGIDYDAAGRLDRIGLFADWHASRFARLTAGLTLNDGRASVVGRGAGGAITIGSTRYTTGQDDRLDVTVEYPTFMPYVGVGLGLMPQRAGDWGFSVDAGLAIGKPRVAGAARGPLLGNAVSAGDVDRELADVRDAIEKVRGIPNLTLGVYYRF